MSLYTLTVDLLLKTGSFEKDAGKSARLFDRQMQQMTASAKRAGTAVGVAIAGGLAAGAAAVVSWSRDVAKLSIEYDRLASISGTTSASFQRMAAGAQTVGISHEKLADILKDTQDKIGDFIQTGGGAMADFFENIAPRIGVTAEQFRKLSGPEALGLYFRSLERANLSQSEMTFYMEAIASDSAQLVPLLKNNAEGFKRWGAAADAAGAIIGDDMVDATRQLRDMTAQADLAMQGIKNSVAEQVLPTVGELTELLGSDQTRQSFASFTGWVAGLTTELVGALVQMGNFINRTKELYTLDTGGALKDSSYDALNEQLGRISQRRKEMEGWTSNHFGIPLTDDQRQFRTQQLTEMAAEQKRLQAEITKRIVGEMPIQDAAPQSWLDSINGNVQYTATGNIGRAAREKSEREAEAASKRQREAQAAFSREAQIAAGIMSGPLSEAMASHRQRVAELNLALEKGSILQADHGVLLAESAKGYAKVAAEIEKAQKAPAILLGTMEQEVQLLGIAGPAREMYRRQLQAEADMRAEISRAQEAGAKFSEQEITQLLAQAKSYAALSIEMEDAARAAEDWQQVAVDAAGGVADTFADVFAGQIKNAKDFFSELKDVFKRGWWDVVRTGLQQQFVNPIQKAIQGMLSGQGFAASGTSFGGLGTTIAGGIVQGAQRAGIGSLGIGTAAGVAAGSIGGFGNNVAGFGGFQGATYGLGGASGTIGGGGSGFGLPPGMGLFGKSLLTGEFAGGLPYAGAGLGLLGAYYGLTKRGSGGLSSVLAGASYGALGLGVGGAIAGGLGAIGTGVGVGGIGAGAAAGATGAMGAIGASSWVPVVGWALAAAAVVDKLSGGKVFGTKYQTNSSQQTIGINEGGGSATAEAYQSRQKSLFGGKKWRTIQVDPGQEARDAAAGIHEVLSAYAKQLGVSLRQDAAALVGGSFSQSYDKKGNVTGSRSTVLGRTYDEDAETFQKRLAAEQAIAAVGKIDGQASRIAEDWRKSAELLEDGANFFVTAAVDARSGLDLWTGVGLSALTDYVEKMQAADESLTAAYTRLAGTAKSYGTLMADIATQVMTADLSGYQQQALTIERTYRQQVKAANDYAKALGLSGARAEDLAKIEELRALQMGKLQAQIEADKKDIKYGLSISDLSPLTDRQKLSESMQALADATAKGDSQAAQQAAQAALGFGRNLFASGKDYNDLYGRVMAMIDGMKVGELDLEDGTSMGQLADAIEALPEHFGKAIFEVAAGGKEVQKETNAKLDEQNQLIREQNQLIQKLLNTTQGAAATQKRHSLNASLNAR
jgi:hypothetical protein